VVLSGWDLGKEARLDEAEGERRNETGLIIGLQALASLFTGLDQSPVVLVIFTLAIAALLQSVRRRLQNLIDRRFYRKKYDAEKALAAFSAAQ
jgi:hypothetical protein